MGLMEELGSLSTCSSVSVNLGVWFWLHLRGRAAVEHPGTLRSTVVGLGPSLKVRSLSQTFLQWYFNSYLYLLSKLKIIFLPLWQSDITVIRVRHEWQSPETPGLRHHAVKMEDSCSSQIPSLCHSLRWGESEVVFRTLPPLCSHDSFQQCI